MNYHLIARMLAYLLLAFCASMVTAIPFAIYYGEFHALLALTESMLVGAALGGCLFLYGRKTHDETIFRREALAIVGLSWLLAGGLGALPFFFGGMTTSYTDAYFESISGLTTTGASILTSIEDKPKALLFWRSFLHFLGGLGIVVILVAVLPVLGVGGKALYKQEVPGPVPEGLTPRIKDTAMILFKIYLGLNVIETVVLMIAGMSFFEAINHAMATMATGGFSTKNSSLAAFASPMIEWIVGIFMFIAGTNFLLHMRFIQGDFKCYFRDVEFRTYLGILLFSITFLAFVLYFLGTTAVSNPESINLRDAMFTTLSIITTTGFGTVDFDLWPPACKGLLLILMFIGGMAGSTAGGMKIIRSVMIAKSAVHQLQTEADPRVVRVLKIGGRAMDRKAFVDAFALFFLWMAVFIGGAGLVAFLTPGQSLFASLSASAACLNNIGPGFEAVGPVGNYASQHFLSKWVLSLMMVMGRLELYIILIILTPRFWLGR